MRSVWIGGRRGRPGVRVPFEDFPSYPLFLFRFLYALFLVSLLFIFCAIAWIREKLVKFFHPILLLSEICLRGIFKYRTRLNSIAYGCIHYISILLLPETKYGRISLSLPIPASIIT